jgi:hypothetical protein
MGSLRRFFDYNAYTTIGAGNYGSIVKSKSNEVLKLLKRVDDCDTMKKEAHIQNKVYSIFKTHLPEVKVPKLTYYSQDRIRYRQTLYLCGIGMKYVEPPEGYTTQVHTLLGYHGSDIDTVWGMHISEPVSFTNPPRGFFASTYTLLDIWEDEGSDMTIEKLAYQMGKAHRLMLDHGILPIDLEWVWSKGSLWVIDFGLCEFERVDPTKFLSWDNHMGLKHDFYIPHKGDRGYEEFLKGYYTP